MLDARVKTVDAMEATVCVEALASLRKVKSFSAGSDSSGSSAQFSCSYCCRLVLIQNLHTKYVTTAMAKTPPMTPPAIAPTLGPELDDLKVLIVDGAAEAATQIVFWHDSHVGGTSEQISPLGHVGHEGVSLGHPVTHRRKRESNDAKDGQ